MAEYLALLDQLKRIFEADISAYRSLIIRVVDVFEGDAAAARWVIALKDLLERPCSTSAPYSFAQQWLLSDCEEGECDLLDELE